MALKRLLEVSAIVLLATTAVACGGGSSGGGATLPVPPPPPPDTTAPTVSFSPATLTVVSAGTGAATLTASDNVAVTTGPTTTCTNGGNFASGTFTAPAVSVETTSVCTATAGDTAGNQGTGTLTVTISAPPTIFTLQGTASKGMMFGGTLTVTDASNAATILAIGTTNTTDGQFSLDITDADFAGDFVRLVVTGGMGAEMLCDAPLGCDGTAFGSRFAIDDTVTLSAIVATPADTTPRIVNLNVFTDLVTRLVDNATGGISDFELMIAQDNVRGLFDFNNPLDFTTIEPLDITQATISSTNFEELRAGMLAGGFLGSLFENGANIGSAWDNFGTLYVQNNGDIIARESVDDPALISLEDILENSAALRGVATATDAEFINNLDLIDSEIVLLKNDAEPDVLTEGGELPIAPPPTPPVTPPVVTFNPSSLTLGPGETAMVTITVVDDDVIVSGPDVLCSNGGNFENDIFTAPIVTVNTTVECEASATDEFGNIGTGLLTVSVEVPDTTAPVVTFDPATLSVESGSVTQVLLSATDDVAVTTGPDVTCTNGGAFANNEFTAPTVTTNTTVVCTATAGDAAGNEGMGTLTATVTMPPPAPTTVTISGKATYDHVPHNASNGLDYANTEQLPIRGATIEALSSTNTVLTTGQTDANGDYSLMVDPNTDVRIRVKAEMLQTTGAQWNIRVQDNTSSDALYALQGSLANSGAVNSTRNLNAASGWGGSSYTATRAAAPFAIMDPVYDGLLKIAAVDPTVNFPLAKFNWSTRNRAVNGTLSDGEIGTSSYRGNGDIYILGDANNDTDEYDGHVDVHEWGHYFEDQLSRSDSVGGQHGGGDRLDPRVAFGEGFGNALSGMVTDDPFYRDSFGNSQANGFSINVENNTATNEGWYNESSVQSILYDIYDTTSDTADTLSLGIGPLYNALVNSDYTGQALFTTIFSFLDQLRTDRPGDITAINTLATDRNVNGTGPDGSGETSNGSIVSALPVYKVVTVNGPAVEICSVDDAGSFNKLGNRAFLSFNVTAAGSHTLTMTRSSGATARDPDFRVFQNGSFLINANGSATNTETASRSLNTGVHVIDAYDSLNVDTTTSQGDACYNFTITR